MLLVLIHEILLAVQNVAITSQLDQGPLHLLAVLCNLFGSELDGEDAVSTSALQHPCRDGESRWMSRKIQALYIQSGLHRFRETKTDGICAMGFSVARYRQLN